MTENVNMAVFRDGTSRGLSMDTYVLNHLQGSSETSEPVIFILFKL